MTRNNLHAICSVLALCILSGCISYDGRPTVATLQSAPQIKLKSAAHWKVVSQDVAEQVAATLKSQALDGTPVYVPSSSDTAFGKVFSSELRSSLLAKRVPVSSSNKSTLQLDIHVDEVQHLVRRQYRPGSLTALAAGVAVLSRGFLAGGGLRTARNAARDETAAIATVLVGADVIGAINESNSRPTTEIVLTTSITRDGRFVMHNTDVYYVDEVDTGLFDSGARVFAVDGSNR